MVSGQLHPPTPTPPYPRVPLVHVVDPTIRDCYGELSYSFKKSLVQTSKRSYFLIFELLTENISQFHRHAQ